MAAMVAAAAGSESAMSETSRARVLRAALEGRISYYERNTHEEIEFDVATGEPIKIVLTHGVCSGCVIDAADRPDERERCCREDPHHRCATVAEVTAYLDGTP